jgi:toxin ParE1/3/4
VAIDVRFTEIALSDLEAAFEYISSDNPKAAREIISQILEGLEQLKKFPESGRTGRRRGTRELVISNLPYIIVYRLNVSTLEILTVLHTARKWP